MKLIKPPKFVLSLVATSLILSGILACKGKNTKLESDTQKVSYLIGLNIVEGAKRSGIDIDNPAFMAGVEDALAGEEKLRMSDEELRAAMQTYQKMVMEKRMAGDSDFQKKATDNAKASQEFLDKNKTASGVKVTASGLQYKVIKSGKGKKPSEKSRVRVHYEGKTVDGKVFDSSLKRDPAEFPVNGVIPGWTEALQLMGKGDKWKLFIPAELAYGIKGPPGIGPNQALIFDVELLDVME